MSDTQARAMLARATRGREQATQEHARIVAENEQRLLDAEVRDTRRSLLRDLRRHASRESAAFMDEYFLTVADRTTLLRAIVEAAVTVSDDISADLQLWDAQPQLLRIVVHEGFQAPFLDVFATLDLSQPTACTTAWKTRTPVLIDHVANSQVFTGLPTLAAILDAGTRAVYSYPLIDRGEALGVLSFHSRRRLPQASAELVARSAASALGPRLKTKAA